MSCMKELPTFSSFCQLLQISAPNDLKLTLSITGSKLLRICISSAHGLQCHSISLYNLSVWVTGHFISITLNDPQITLNTIRSKVTLIWATNITASQSSIRVPVQPAVCESQAILKQVVRNDIKATLDTTTKKQNICSIVPAHGLSCLSIWLYEYIL